MKYKYVIVEKSEGVCTLVFNRPDKYNAINWEMEGEVFKALKEIAEDKEVRVLVITGAGSAFCTGADMEGMLQANIDQGGLTGEEIYEMPFPDMVPVIAAVNGFAIGAGFTMILSCDIRIAAEEAKFSLPFVPIGAIPEAGSIYFLPKLAGISRAMELALTGRAISANEAKEYGLVTDVVPGAQLKDTVYKLAKKIAAAPPLSVMAAKKGFYQCLSGNIKDAIEYEKSTLKWLLKTEDHQEAVKAYMDKRKPVFKGK